jgi:hypothetical protein
MLVSVVNMANVFAECKTEEQRSVMRFFVVKRLNAQDIYKKRFLFTVGSVRVNQFTIGSRNSLKDVRKSQTMPGHVALLRLSQKQGLPMLRVSTHS